MTGPKRPAAPGVVQSRGTGAWTLMALLAACQPGHGADPAQHRGSTMARSDPSQAPSAAAGEKPAAKSGTGQLRTDAEPVLKRFPLLGRPLALQWMSGTLGDSRVPGPSTYWIDAVADLPAEHAAWLRQNYGLAAGSSATAAPAGLLPPLQALLAPGPWQSSRELDAALSQQGFVVRAHLQGDRLVLVAVGQ
jgi:hypothetical protein